MMTSRAAHEDGPGPLPPPQDQTAAPVQEAQAQAPDEQHLTFSEDYDSSQLLDVYRQFMAHTRDEEAAGRAEAGAPADVNSVDN